MFELWGTYVDGSQELLGKCEDYEEAKMTAFELIIDGADGLNVTIIVTKESGVKKSIISA